MATDAFPRIEAKDKNKEEWIVMAKHVSQDITKTEASLLMYLECCCVDYGGAVEGRRLADEDMEIIERWKKSGFISFGRISAADIFRFAENRLRPSTHWCKLSQDAWSLAHVSRWTRAMVQQNNRTWSKVRDERS